MSPSLSSSSHLEARIRQVYGQLSAAERKLADVVLVRPRDLLGYSATELAQLAGTSKSSAARFFRSLGYDGYDTFRQALRDAQQQQSPLARLPSVRRSDAMGQQFQAHLLADAARLQAWAEAVPEAQLQAALTLLARARKVWVLGYRHSHVTAFYAKALLAQIRPEVLMLHDAAGCESELLACVQPKDVVLAVDFRRRSQRLSQVLAGVRSVGAQVLLITDAPVSALAMHSTVVLRCGTSSSAEQAPFDSYVCAVSLINFLGTTLGHQLRGSAHGRLVHIEHLHVALNDLEPQL